MKPKIIKPAVVVLLLLFIGASCQKDDFEVADESIVVDNFPGVSIYKTKGNYFNNIAFKLTPDGHPNGERGYTLKDPRIKVDNKGRISPNFRWYLKSGYIVDIQVDSNEVFTDISFQEYVDYNTKTGLSSWPDELLIPRIVDKNPFTEFYYMGCINCPIKKFTLGELNTMLENGTIEEHFTKLK